MSLKNLINRLFAHDNSNSNFLDQNNKKVKLLQLLFFFQKVTQLLLKFS